MAEERPAKPTLFSSLLKLGRSLVDLVRTVRNEWPISDVASLQHHASEEPPPQLTLPPAEEHSENAQLLTQHTPGWYTCHPSRLPLPTYAPAMTAFGIVFIALGAVTSWPLSVIGSCIFVLAIAKWIGELLHD